MKSSIPSEIGKLTKLNTLNLGKSRTMVNQNLINVYISIYVIVFLESNLMINILFCSYLKEQNYLTGSMPSEIGLLTELVYFNLGKSRPMVNQKLINFYISIYVVVCLT